MMEQWKDNPSPRIFYNFFSFNPEISPQIFLSQVKLENIPCRNAVPLLNRFVSFWIFKFLPYVKVKRLIKNSSKEQETWSKEGNERDDGCNFLRLPKRRNKKKKKKFDTIQSLIHFLRALKIKADLRGMMIYSQPRRHPHDFLCRQLVLLTRELLVTVTADSHVYTYVWLSCAAAWDDDSPNAPFFIVSATLVISMDLRYRTPKHDTQENAISSLPPLPSLPPLSLGKLSSCTVN